LQNIESAFLLDNQFFNNLPGRIRQMGIFNIDETELDLLLLTYAWRRFNPAEREAEQTNREIAEYDYLTIENPGPLKRTRREITLTTLEGGEVLSLEKDTKGKAILPFKDLDARVRQIMLLPDKNPSANAYGINIRFPENDAFIKQVKSAGAVTIPPENKFTIREFSEKDILIDSAIQIEEVTIRAPLKPVEVFYDKYQQIYQYASLKTISKREIAGCLNLEDILVRLNPYRLDVKNKVIYLRPGRRIMGAPSPTLVVFDDIPLYEMNYANISDFPASQIASVTALKGDQGFAVYGEAATGGVVFITTDWKKMADGDNSEIDFTPARPEDDLMRAISIFRKEAEYYIPTKEEVSLIPEYQVRPTLYWNDEIVLDGKGPVTVTFPNHMLPGKVLIIANGVSFRNMPGAAKASYVIK
ncbi:MAG: Plug domain-containing protein, partial [Bacteroidales bacterium]|nr:Plug domain-containing protein [Bacteroidales bacterium]